LLLLCPRITCLDPRQLPREFAGRDFDKALLATLPPSVDPRGERGEFHVFAFARLMLQHTVAITTGEIVERDGFVFDGLLPATP
jgi:diphthamide synthase (EF-2-diphthine--ammonia ligase)